MATEQMTIGLYSPVPRSGKTTVAQILVNDFDFKRHSFAEPIKRMLVELMSFSGFSNEEIWNYMDMEKELPIPLLGNKSFRYLAQTLGTDWGRQLVDRDVWINIVTNNPQRANFIVIDDVRFPNEFDAIKRDGGEIWKIERAEQALTTKHPSEGLLEEYEFDEIIRNDKDIADLRIATHRAFKGL